MRVDAFDFLLPPDRIALTPAHPRDSARMLVVGADGGLTDSHVRDLPDFLTPRRRAGRQRYEGHRGAARGRPGQRRCGRFDRGDAHRARRRLPLAGARASGQEAQGGRAHPLRRGERKHGLPSRGARRGNRGQGRSGRGSAALSLRRRGAGRSDRATRRPPFAALHRLSPRRNRERSHGLSDDVRGQTRRGGGADGGAAFHAGAGCSPDARGVALHRVTLHVGAGTFTPVKVDDTRDHKMQSEWGSIDAATAEALNAVRERGSRVVCVGTTSARMLESAADENWSNSTVFRRNGYFYHVPDTAFASSTRS